MACMMILMLIILYYQITCKIQSWRNMDVITLYHGFINLYQTSGHNTLKNDIMVSYAYMVIYGLLWFQNHVDVQIIAGYFFAQN